MAFADISLVSGGGTYTAAAGSNRLVVIMLSRERTSGGGANPAATTLALGASSLANGRIVAAGSAPRWVTAPLGNAHIWYIKEADIEVGAQSLSVTWNATMAGTQDLFTIYTLTGRNQTTPVDNTTSIDFESPTDPWTLSLTVVTGTDVCLCAWVTATTDLAPATGWVEDRQTADGTAYGAYGAHYENAAAGSLDCTLDLADTRTGTVVVVSFAEAPSAGAAPSLYTVRSAIRLGS